MGVGDDTGKKAIAWAVRNQMLSLNVATVSAARGYFKDAHDKSGDANTKKIAKSILKQDMTGDTTSGAIKWFSPRSMPKKGESCKGYDCSGGLITVNKKQVYAPGFHKTMTYVSVGREWYVRFYKL